MANRPPCKRLDIQSRTGEGVADGGLQGFGIADFADGLQRCRQISAVVMQHRRAGAQLRLAHRRVGVAAKVIVEAPAADELTQLQDFR